MRLCSILKTGNWSCFGLTKQHNSGFYIKRSNYLEILLVKYYQFSLQRQLSSIQYIEIGNLEKTYSQLNKISMTALITLLDQYHIFDSLSWKTNYHCANPSNNNEFCNEINHQLYGLSGLTFFKLIMLQGK